jgi:hypothetical protein
VWDHGWVPDEQATSTRPRMPAWWSTQAALPERPRNPRRRAAIAIIAGVVLVGLIAGLVVFQMERSRYHTLIGAIDVGSIKYNSQCRLAPIYHGIREGTPVVIRTTRGDIVGRSALGPGVGVGPFCEFVFAVKVPIRDYYTIEVDHRGQVTYSLAYLDFFRWRAGLALSGARMTWQ